MASPQPVTALLLALCCSTGLPAPAAQITLAQHVSEDAAVSVAAEATGGRVLAVRLESDSNTYLIKVLMPDGRVTMVAVDANTGVMR